MKKYAWFEPSKGPEEILGVRLAYVQDAKEFYDNALREAEEAGHDQGRIARLNDARIRKLTSSSPYFYPQINWWMSMESFQRGDGGWANITKDTLPDDVVICDSKEDAIEMAEQELADAR